MYRNQSKDKIQYSTTASNQICEEGFIRIAHYLNSQESQPTKTTNVIPQPTQQLLSLQLFFYFATTQPLFNIAQNPLVLRRTPQIPLPKEIHHKFRILHRPIPTIPFTRIRIRPIITRPTMPHRTPMVMLHDLLKSIARIRCCGETFGGVRGTGGVRLCGRAAVALTPAGDLLSC